MLAGRFYHVTAKSPDRIGDARVILEDAREELAAGPGEVETAAAAAPHGRLFAWVAAALLVGGLLGAWLAGLGRPAAPSAEPARFSLLLPDDAPYYAEADSPFVMSPSGDRVFYLAKPANRPPQRSQR